jgi:hypothetical protein
MEYKNIATNSSFLQNSISINFIWVLVIFISIIIIGNLIYKNEKLAKKRKKG